MSRPVWLLDVDGVLNADHPGWGAPPWRDYVSDGTRLYRMRWAPELIRRIRKLDSEQVEIRWCTNWCGHTDQIEHVMGLGPYGCVELPREHVGTVAMDGYKQQAALEVLMTERRPLIWTDDTAVPHTAWQLKLWHEARRHLTQDTLLVRPHPRMGLQPEHMDQIEHMIKVWNGEPSEDPVDWRCPDAR